MEKLEFALQVMAVGFSVVMLTLLFLYGALFLFSRIFCRARGEAAGASEAPRAAAVTGPEGEGVIPPRLAAAVVAAVYRYMQQDSSAAVAVTVAAGESKKACAGYSWRAAGRKVLLERTLELERLRRERLREKI